MSPPLPVLRAGDAGDDARRAEVLEPERAEDAPQEMVGFGSDLPDHEPALRAERPEVLERDDVDVGRVVPLEGQLRVHGQVAAEEQQQAAVDAVLAWIS